MRVVKGFSIPDEKILQDIENCPIKLDGDRIVTWMEYPDSESKYQSWKELGITKYDPFYMLCGRPNNTFITEKGVIGCVEIRNIYHTLSMSREISFWVGVWDKENERWYRMGYGIHKDPNFGMGL